MCIPGAKQICWSIFLWMYTETKDLNAVFPPGKTALSGLVQLTVTGEML
jgi:hypothetical protein